MRVKYSWKYSLAPMRYVLVLRDGEHKRVAMTATPRSLVELNGSLRSLFDLHPDATTIDVILFGAGQQVDDQEVLVSAERYSGPGGRYIWYRTRDLRAIESDVVARAAILADAEPEVLE